MSSIGADGLPKFRTHIAFVLCNEGVSSGRDLSETSFKPGIAVMLLQDARKLYKLKNLDAQKVSRFVGEIKGESRPVYRLEDHTLSGRRT